MTKLLANRDSYGAATGTAEHWRDKCVRELTAYAAECRQTAEHFRDSATALPKIEVGLTGVTRPRRAPLQKARTFEAMADVYEEWITKVKQDV